LKPYWGKPAVRNFRGGEGDVMQGLASICHETRKGGHNGRRWPKHRRAFSLLDVGLGRSLYGCVSCRCKSGRGN